MGVKHLVQVKVDGFVRITEGTTTTEVANEYQYRYEDDILLVRINGKLQELHKHGRTANSNLSRQDGQV